MQCAYDTKVTNNKCMDETRNYSHQFNLEHHPWSLSVGCNYYKEITL